LAKYDHGGGCACGLYRECPPDCEHYQGEKRLTDEIFDFGFTAVTEEELTTALPAVHQAEYDREHVIEMERRLDKLHSAILPLLDNLRKNPESEYIRWPNRDEKIDAFESYIAKIVDGDIE